MISLSHVNKKYVLDDDVIFSALKDINVTIEQGEFTSIIGPSGSGKSTLMHIIGLLDQPTSGQIRINNKDVSKLNDDQLSSLRNEFVGFVFQQFNLINKLSVMENILIPTIYTRSKLSHDPLEKARYLIKRFGLEGKENSFPNRISGGQQQRVAIARALIMNPKLILADEPTGNLDTKTGTEILKLLHELHEHEKITVIIVTHDPNIAAQTKRKIEIRDGEIQ
ncbi:ABC transporter ATP-binding protein [Candidatus Roizmanbacteria bacterium]|nr:ABC transporter ATP-binding protein [Candidatus Roizmanbacteria bacterium]